MSSSKPQHSPEFMEANERYKAAVVEEQAAFNSVEGIPPHLDQIKQRLAATQADVEALEQQLATIADAIAEGTADISTVDTIDPMQELLDATKRKLARYQELERSVSEQLSAARNRLRDKKSHTKSMLAYVYRQIALELQAEARPVLQRLSVALRESLSYAQTIAHPWGYDRDEFIHLLREAHSIATIGNEAYADLKNDIDAIFFAEPVKKAGSAKGTKPDAAATDPAALPLS